MKQSTQTIVSEMYKLYPTVNSEKEQLDKIKKQEDELSSVNFAITAYKKQLDTIARKEKKPLMKSRKSKPIENIKVTEVWEDKFTKEVKKDSK